MVTLGTTEVIIQFNIHFVCINIKEWLKSWLKGYSNFIVLNVVCCRFKELSRALYSLTILAEAQNMLSVNVPAGRVNDIAGNPNLASNQLEVKKCVKTYLPLTYAFSSSS